jgi:hypothetical protein
MKIIGKESNLKKIQFCFELHHSFPGYPYAYDENVKAEDVPQNVMSW